MKKRRYRTHPATQKISRVLRSAEAEEIKHLLELADYCDRMNAEYERALAAQNPYRIVTSASSNEPVNH